MDLTTTRRHLLAALCALGTDEGRIEQRLHAAYAGGLRRLSRADLPDDVRPEYLALMAELADLYSRPDRIDAERASRLAKRVVKLYERVIKER